MFIFRTLVVCHKAWIGYFVFGGLNVQGCLYTFLNFQLEMKITTNKANNGSICEIELEDFVFYFVFYLFLTSQTICISIFCLETSYLVFFFFFLIFYISLYFIYIFFIEILHVGRKWFMGQAHIPRENPKAQAEEDYGPSSTK